MLWMKDAGLALRRSGRERWISKHAAPLVALLLTLSQAPSLMAQLPQRGDRSRARPAEPTARMADGQQRWQEQSFGVSLVPPRGAALFENPSAEFLLRMTDPGAGYAVTAQLRAASRDIDVDGVFRNALPQIAFVHPSAVLMEQTKRRIGERPGGVLYCRIVDAELGPWVLGQAFLLIDPTNLFVLEMTTAQADFDRNRAVFEALLDSIALASPEEINRIRTEQIDRGVEWLKTVDMGQLRRQLAPERWYRVIENDVDVGYMRVRQQVDEGVGQEGLRVDVQLRVVRANRYVDTLLNLFLSEDQTNEIWSIRTTVRARDAQQDRRPPLGPRPRPQPPRGLAPAPTASSFAETGLRSHEDITVTLETPSGVTHHQWKKPPTGYLAHAMQHLIGPLLPRDREQTLAFYSYHSQSNEITFRSERIVPLDGGAYRVHTRPATDKPEMVTEYDAYGRMTRQTFADGRLILPSTGQHIANLWGVR